MNKKQVDVFVIALASPILIGLYENNKLITTLSKDGKTSEVLPEITKDILKDYNIQNIIYVNGPGSYMAIKVSYIFLKTICIINNINFYACSGFEVNDNSPIKALGKKYFVQDVKKEVYMRVLNEGETLNNFKLPPEISLKNYSTDTLPKYNLPAVI